MEDSETSNWCVAWLAWLRGSRTVIQVIVFISLFTDSMLLTLVDPILPDILHNIDTKGMADSLPESANASESGNITMFPPVVQLEDINLNGRYGYLVAAKGATQFICNPFVGLIVSSGGYRIPMLIGDIILLVSTVAFAYGRTYFELFITRMFQGASSAVTAVTGMGLLAAIYTDDEERGKVMGIAIAGISLGIVVGPIYGSLLYQYFGQAVPFLVVAGMIGVALVLQVITVKRDSYDVKDHSFKSMLYLIADPYILIVAVNIFLLNLDVSMVLAFLPLRLIELSNPDTWQLGVVVLPTSIGYLLAGIIFPRTSQCLARWLCGMFGLIISSLTLFILAISTTFVSMLVVTTFLGIALGMVSTSMQPIFAHLVDIRHSCMYGNVYAISDMAVCFALFVGPLVGGPVLYAFGFKWLLIGVGTLNLGFAAFSFLLRDPPAFLSKPRETLYEEFPKEKKNKEVEFRDTEKAPLIRSHKKSTTASHCSSVASTRTSRSATMDLSSVPIPRYLYCLSAAEDLYATDLESLASHHTAASF